MKSCAFFGHRYIDPEIFGKDMHHILVDLIENKGVTQFYSGFRGDFDRLCSFAVYTMKEKYPMIKNTMVLSYIPDKDFILPKYFDDSVYLLEKQVPKRFAISATNKLLVDKVDYIVACVLTHGGGAYAALEYARRRNKPIINVLDER